MHELDVIDATLGPISPPLEVPLPPFGEFAEPPAYPEPENRGRAALSPLGAVEYVDDLLRPGRTVVLAAEEGTGKSYASLELGVRVAVAGGKFADTWEVQRTGPVLVLSEMHADDDYQREETILAALGRTRDDLDGRYYRLSLFTAANGQPALMDDGWRAYIADWMASHRVLLAIFDTGTVATNVDPWGKEMQQVFRNAKQLLEALPQVVLLFAVHLKKPQGRGGERGLSAVLGEWGRWSDVLLMMENEGSSLERVKLTVRKRVRQERRFVATKRDGLLVEPVVIESGAGTKVPLDEVLTVIEQRPGLNYKALGEVLGVSKDTAGRYARAAQDAGRVNRRKVDGEWRMYPGEESEDEMLEQLRVPQVPHGAA
jgi:hypothetical protein